MDQDLPRTRNQAVFDYIRARQRFEQLRIEAADAARRSQEAQEDMRQAWVQAWETQLEPGIYAFKEHGRTAIVVQVGDGPQACPHLLTIVS